jgi:hypothetical protein
LNKKAIVIARARAREQRRQSTRRAGTLRENRRHKQQPAELTSKQAEKTEVDKNGTHEEGAGKEWYRSSNVQPFQCSAKPACAMVTAKAVSQE